MQSKRFWFIIFWIASLLILYRLFTINYSNGWADFVYTVIFHLPLFLVVYLNLKLIEKYFDRVRYLHYFIGTVFTFLVGCVFHYVLFEYLVDLIVPGFYIIGMDSIIELGQYISAYILLSLLFNLSVDWFGLKKKQLELEKAHNEEMLTRLKAQLNPHFLFNSLNNIYSLIPAQSGSGRNHLLQLSNALRYMLYKTNEDKVPLSGELEYLENYIALERLRLEDKAKINLVLPKMSNDYKIAPLILLPFIENCFKHCDKDAPIVNVEIILEDNSLLLNCKNNIGIAEQNRNGGLGLNNSKKRLQLIYSEKHKLQIKKEKRMYSVRLELTLDKLN